MYGRLLTQGHFSSMCELTLFCLLLLALVPAENCSLLNRRKKKEVVRPGFIVVMRW